MSFKCTGNQYSSTPRNKKKKKKKSKLVQTYSTLIGDYIELTANEPVAFTFGCPDVNYIDWRLYLLIITFSFQVTTNFKHIENCVLFHMYVTPPNE